MRNENGYDSFLADSTSGIPANRRVKFSGNGRRITLAGAADREIAVTKVAVSDNNTPVECRLVNAPGNVEVEVNGAFTRGQIVKRDAAGKVAVAGAGTDFAMVDADSAGNASGTDTVAFMNPL